MLPRAEPFPESLFEVSGAVSGAIFAGSLAIPFPSCGLAQVGMFSLTMPPRRNSGKRSSGSAAPYMVSRPEPE